MSVRDELLAACEAGDHQAVHRRGWSEVWEVLATGWSPRQTCSLSELKPYVKLLGDYDPAEVVAAIEACAGEWRPVPGEIRGRLNGKRDDASRVDAGRGRNLALAPEIVTQVARAVSEGLQPCSCGSHGSEWRGPHSGRQPRPGCRRAAAAPGVMRCAKCGGAEPGQVYAAEDAGLLEAA